MKAFVITIPGLPLSEQGAKLCISSGRQFGCEVERFPATDCYTAEEAMRSHGLQIDGRIYKEISDRPVGDRDTIPKGQWWLTTPEVGCFMSHYRLWNTCIELKQPLLILEHDVVFTGAIPAFPPGAQAMYLVDNSYPDTAAYILSPGGARLAVKQAKRHGIQPSDELLWRTALRKYRIAISPPFPFKVENHGLSTIQFSRKDATHQGMSDVNPWRDYCPQHGQRADSDD
jgi:GR25 family glycosyltransferase involved in LPS biosynthesis